MPRLEFQCRHRFHHGFDVDVAFESDRRFMALFGPSGAGKTTILSMLAGFRKPQSGRVRLANRLLLDTNEGISMPVRHRSIGMVFQDALLFPHLTVESNLRYGQRHRKLQKTRVEFHRVVEVLEIGHLLRRYPRNLSGGEKQRVAMGRALLSGPELLLMDEPLAALDASLKGKILTYLERAVAEWDIPTLFVTHSQADVRRAAEWVVVINKGRVVASGSPEDALGQPGPLGWNNSTGPMNLVRFDRVETLADRVQGWIGSQSLTLPPRDGSTSVPRFVQFSPADVIVCRNDVSGISARNRLRGGICRIAQSNQSVFLAIDVGQTIWAEITPEAACELDLKLGTEVVCLLKTHRLSAVGADDGPLPTG